MITTQSPSPARAPALRDVHVPPDPSWWPPALGWWLSGLLLLLVLFATAWVWRRWILGARERRGVLEEVERCRVRHERDADAGQLAGGLHQLLRRVARTHDPEAARQQGDAWRATLERVPVDADTLQQLLELEPAMYRADGALDAPRALAAVRTWLRLALRRRNWKPAVITHA